MELKTQKHNLQSLGRWFNLSLSMSNNNFDSIDGAVRMSII